MAPKFLVKEDIERGKRLLQALDERGVHVQAAFWAYKPEANHYQLVFGSDDVESQGTMPLYGKIQDALETIPPGERVRFADVAVTSMSRGLVSHLRTQVTTPADAIEAHRFTDEVIDRELVEDALVYRLAPSDSAVSQKSA
jgi:hypothetical protein